jgi:hypothetical protein
MKRDTDESKSEYEEEDDKHLTYLNAKQNMYLTQMSMA